MIIQLARLGDLLQTIPAVQALKARDPNSSLDLLAAAPLAQVASLIPGVDGVIPWDGQQWREWARLDAVASADAAIGRLVPRSYETVYNLNNHPRAVLAAHLCGRRIIGPGQGGPLSTDLPPWAAYLRQVAATRGENRVHLADAWCGLCGVRPSGQVPRLAVPKAELPADLAGFGETGGLRVAVVVGAGSPERRVSHEVWARWITGFLRECSEGAIVLVGSAAEHEGALAIEAALSPLARTRVWNATGRTSLLQLAALLASCHWVIGGDTGPLHLGAAVGARAMGWYVARARVHETGPYGEGHWVWQADGLRVPDPTSREAWPVEDSIELLLNGASAHVPAWWSLWRSHVDRWGAYFTEAGVSPDPDSSREVVWRQLG